jgi:SAM-dependent methyltransferase
MTSFSTEDASADACQAGSVVPYDPRRFRSAAAHYLAGRPPYAERLIRRVAQFCALRRDDQILDLGCGPGQLACAFAPLAGHVTAMDPEPEMLMAAQELVASKGIANIAVVKGSSLDLGPHLGRFKLVGIGRAFHWMDRVDTLHRLDRIIDRDGSVVLFDDKHLRLPENVWHDDFEALHDRYSDGDSGRQIRKGPDWLSHEAILLRSAFPVLERVSAIDRHPLTSEQLIDRVLSRSATTPARLGERIAEMAGEIRKLVGKWGRDGLLTEVVETRALIACRA